MSLGIRTPGRGWDIVGLIGAAPRWAVASSRLFQEVARRGLAYSNTSRCVSSPTGALSVAAACLPRRQLRRRDAGDRRVLESVARRHPSRRNAASPRDRCRVGWCFRAGGFQLPDPARPQRVNSRQAPQHQHRCGKSSRVTVEVNAVAATTNPGATVLPFLARWIRGNDHCRSNFERW